VGWQTARVELEAFELVILRRPPEPAQYDDETLDRIQAEHLAYLDGLRRDGHTVAHGPVRDQPDESVRGLVVFRVGSLDEARRLAEADPAVRAGRMTVVAMTWLCPAGSTTRPGRAL
jgi:uncharacterized protein YciI